jgi:hypothetical protein
MKGPYLGDECAKGDPGDSNAVPICAFHQRGIKHVAFNNLRFRDTKLFFVGLAVLNKLLRVSVNDARSSSS